MINNIFKLQSGGGVQLPFVSYNPIVVNLTPTTPFASSLSMATQSKKSTSTTSSSDEKGALTDKDLLNMVKEINGLPSDVQMVARAVSSLLYLNPVQGLPGVRTSTSLLALKYLLALTAVKMANFNNKLWDNARSTVLGNKGLTEYAVTDQGKVVVNTKDGIKFMTPEEYHANRQSAQPLTNEQLLYLRAHDPRFANNNDILSVVANGVGLEHINQLIHSFIGSLGTSTFNETGYSKRELDQITEGIEYLRKAVQLMGDDVTEGMTLDGIYKSQVISTSNAKQALTAVEYIYNMLPENSKTVLELHAGSKKGAKDLIVQFVTMGLTTSNSIGHELKWDTDMHNVGGKDTKSKSSGSGDDKDTDEKSNPYWNMVKHIGGVDRRIEINRGTNYEMAVNGTQYGSIPGLDGKPVSRTSVSNLLLSGLAGIVSDPHAIMFGNLLVDPKNWSNMYYDGTGGIVATLPCKVVKGHKVVDIELVKRFEEAKELIKKLPKDLTNLEKKTREMLIFINKGLTELIDKSTGSLNPNRVADFMLVQAYAVDKGSNTYNNESNEGFLKEVNIGDDQELKTLIEYGLSTNDKHDNYSIDEDNWYDFNGHDTVYLGTLYIPITNNENLAVAAFKDNTRMSTAYEREEEAQRLQKLLQALTSSSNVL